MAKQSDLINIAVASHPFGRFRGSIKAGGIKIAGFFCAWRCESRPEPLSQLSIQSPVQVATWLLLVAGKKDGHTKIQQGVTAKRTSEADPRPWWCEQQQQHGLPVLPYLQVNFISGDEVQRRN
jgi:hypothetical protein